MQVTANYMVDLYLAMTVTQVCTLFNTNTTRLESQSFLKVFIYRYERSRHSPISLFTLCSIIVCIICMIRVCYPKRLYSPLSNFLSDLLNGA